MSDGNFVEYDDFCNYSINNAFEFEVIDEFNKKY